MNTTELINTLERGPHLTQEEQFNDAMRQLCEILGEKIDDDKVSLDVVFGGLADGMEGGITSFQKMLLQYYELQSKLLPAPVILAVQAAGFILAVRGLRDIMTGGSSDQRSWIGSLFKSLLLWGGIIGGTAFIGKKLIDMVAGDKEYDSDEISTVLSTIENFIMSALPAPVRPLVEAILGEAKSTGWFGANQQSSGVIPSSQTLTAPQSTQSPFMASLTSLKNALVGDTMFDEEAHVLGQIEQSLVEKLDGISR